MTLNEEWGVAGIEKEWRQREKQFALNWSKDSRKGDKLMDIKGLSLGGSIGKI